MAAEAWRALAAVTFLDGIIFSTPFVLFVFYKLLCDPYLRPLLILYLLWTNMGPGRRAAATGSWRPRLRRWSLWCGLADYFPARLHKTVDLDPSKNYLFGFCPHGIIGTAVWCGFATEACGFSQLFPGIDLRVGTIRWNLAVPLAREFCLLHGFFDVARHNCLRLLAAPGRAILIVLGGAAEAAYTERGCYDLVLRKRKGFVKVALKSGACLVPIIAFGENDLFMRVHMPLLDWVQAVTKKLGGFTLPLAYGQGLFGLRLGILPRRRPLDIVVGAPIEVPVFTGSLRSEEGRAAVERYHRQYMEALQALWDKHKDEFARDRVRELRFVE